MPGKLTKRFLTIDEQIDLLKSRDLLFRSEEMARHYLTVYGYYRITNYLYHFRKYSVVDRGVKVKEEFKDHYVAGTFFEDAIDLCLFDQKLRMLVLEGALEINRSFGVYLGYRFSETKEGKKLPSFGTGGPYRRGLSTDDRKKVDRIHKNAVKNNLDDPSIAHNIERYGNLYSWVLVNYVEFGSLLELYSFASPKVRLEIACDAGFVHANAVGLDICEDFVACNEVVRKVRNVCAHNGRFFDQTFSVAGEEVEPKEIDGKKVSLLNISVRQNSFLYERLKGLSLDGNKFVGEGNDDVTHITAFGALSILSLMLERAGWNRYKEWRREVVALLTTTQFSHTDIPLRVGLRVLGNESGVTRQLGHRLWDRH